MNALKKRITHKEVLERGIVPWTSWKTTKRKIQSENFPAYFESGKWYFVAEEIEVWFKRKKFNSAA